jgi:hypothetical protein
VAAVVVALTVTAGPAAAHDVGSLLSYYETQLTSVAPDIVGIEISVIETGNRMEARNSTDVDLVVLGYEDEPYLRIGPDGAFENLNSPATYLNADRDSSATVPGRADAAADPEWEKIGDEPLARWHDHRIHWMAPLDPPAVQEAPDEEHVVIADWVVPMEYGDESIEVVGDLLWIPSPSPAVFAVLILVLGGAMTATGLLASWRMWSAGGIVAMLAATTASVFGVGLFAVGSTASQLTESVTDAPYLPFLIVGGVVAIVLLLRRHPLAPYLTIFTGTVGAIFGGVLQARLLTNSVLPTALDDTLARALVAVALGVGLGLLGAGIVAITRDPARQATPEPDGAVS